MVKVWGRNSNGKMVKRTAKNGRCERSWCRWCHLAIMHDHSEQFEIFMISRTKVSALVLVIYTGTWYKALLTTKAALVAGSWRCIKTKKHVNVLQKHISLPSPNRFSSLSRWSPCTPFSPRRTKKKKKKTLVSKLGTREKQKKLANF